MSAQQTPPPRISVTLDQLIALRQRLPRLPQLSRLRLSAAHSGRGLVGALGRGLMFEELRHYRPGDDIRLLDWKVTRRTGQPHLRVYNEEREQPQYLLLDLRSSMFFASQGQMKSVLATELAALLLWQALQRGDRCGLLLLSGEAEAELFRPVRSDVGLIAMLRRLAECSQQLAQGLFADNPEGSLNRSLSQLEHLCRQGADIWLISDTEGLAGIDPARLQPLMRRNRVRLVEVSDPLEQQLPAAGRWLFADSEQLLELDTDELALRQHFAAQYQLLQQKIAALLKGISYGHLQLTTTIPLQSQLQSLAGGRRDG